MWAKTKRWRRTHPHRPLCTFAHVEGVCDTPLQFYVITRWCKNVLKQLQVQIVHCAKTAWSYFKPKLFTVQDLFYIVQYPFVHVQKPLELTSMPFCTRAKPLELTSIPFCTRAKTPWTNFKPFLHTCKTSMQTFKDLLYTMQNRHANVQGLFVHDAKPPCKRSSTFCTRRKTVMQTFKDFLFLV